jgi:outer membrane protein assembly factor BamE (lipoprotein component of BamABCDE complex)
MIGMSKSEVKSLLGRPPAARDYTEADGTTYYSWDYTQKKPDRIWLVRRHKVIFDIKSKMVIKTMSYYSDDDDD